MKPLMSLKAGRMKKRDVKTQYVQFDGNIIEEKDLEDEFKKWIEEWKFSESDKKLRIKNLFMHLFLRYDFDSTNKQLNYVNTIGRQYQANSIMQDLDHIDARTIDKTCAQKFFHYNLDDRRQFTNSLGNMMPLPVSINRSKHNTSASESIGLYGTQGITGWIFDETKDLFNNNKTTQIDSTTKVAYDVPTEQFFKERKSRLMSYFNRIVKNQKENPDPAI